MTHSDPSRPMVCGAQKPARPQSVDLNTRSFPYSRCQNVIGRLQPQFIHLKRNINSCHSAPEADLSRMRDSSFHFFLILLIFFGLLSLLFVSLFISSLSTGTLFHFSPFTFLLTPIYLLKYASSVVNTSNYPYFILFLYHTFLTVNVLLFFSHSFFLSS
jgi:hypothetical protein